jgi:hypothetical protein
MFVMMLSMIPSAISMMTGKSCQRICGVSDESLIPTHYIYLTHIKLIYNDIGARRKGGRYGEDGEEHKHKCDARKCMFVL